MKFNLKKIATIVGSTLMIGATAGMAAAASLPSSFTSDLAIVYGSSAAASDQAAALTITSGLLTGLATSGATTVTGGDSFALDKSSDHLQFNETLNSVYASLDKDELKAFLADGTYDSGDVDEDYEQKITFGSEVLSLFADNKFKNDAPTVGFWFSNNEHVLNYTITFDNAIPFTDMNDTEMPFLGKDYYVLAAEANKITLLDSANKVVLAEGDTVTVGGKTVSIEFISDTQVKLNVDGEVTDSIAVGGTDKLRDGSYVVVTDNLYATKETGISKVEFSIGSGKIILETGKDVIIGEDSDDEIDNLKASVYNNSVGLTSIDLEWKSKDNSFLAEGNPITMPGFEALTLVFDGLNYPTESEKISLDNGETLTLNMGNYEIPLMWYNGTDYAQGEENYPLKIAASNYTYANAGYTNNSVVWFNGATLNSNTAVNTTNNLTASAIAAAEDDRFIVTRMDDDLSDVETLYYEVSELEIDDGVVSVTLNDLIGTNDLTFDEVTGTDEAGDVTVTLVGFNAANTTAYLQFSAGSSTITYDKAVSEKGLVVTIPSAAESAVITFTEADKDEDINEGVAFTATVANSTNDKLYVTLGAGNVSKEETTTDENYLAMVKSALASKISTDESGDEYDFEIEYFGKEVYADAKVVADGVVTPTTGVMTYKDSETSAFAGKNLIVIGGSCVNSLASSLLSGAACGQSFTDATTVKAGEAIIKSFPRDGGKLALLVAGYNAEDTTKAATYLANKGLSVVEGTALKVTSITDATAIVA